MSDELRRLGDAIAAASLAGEWAIARALSEELRRRQEEAAGVERIDRKRGAK